MTIRTLGDRTNNAQAIADAAELGYIDGRVLDATYGLGRFWTLWAPADLVTNDIDGGRLTDHSCDFTKMPHDWAGAFDTVVFDPPYKYSGTASNAGPAALNADYGIGEYMSVYARNELIHEGLLECERVLDFGGHLLVKCQDQVVSGKKEWQSKMVYFLCTGTLGLKMVDELLVQSYRAQPNGRSQKHSRIDFSNLLIFRKS